MSGVEVGLEITWRTSRSCSWQTRSTASRKLDPKAPVGLSGVVGLKVAEQGLALVAARPKASVSEDRAAGLSPRRGRHRS